MAEFQVQYEVSGFTGPSRVMKEVIEADGFEVSADTPGQTVFKKDGKVVKLIPTVSLLGPPMRIVVGNLEKL